VYSLFIWTLGFAPVQLPDNPKLYVRCLNKQTTKMEVNEVFSRYGIIEDIYMALDDMKICRGYAFVQFSCKEMALAAIKALNGLFTIRGSDQPLIVRFADPKKPRLGEQRFYSFLFLYLFEDLPNFLFYSTQFS
jgi:RNA recognition motif-containing protein